MASNSIADAWGTQVRTSANYIYIMGKAPSGKYGVWVIKRYTRMFDMEPTIRNRKLQSKEIIKLLRAL